MLCASSTAYAKLRQIWLQIIRDVSCLFTGWPMFTLIKLADPHIKPVFQFVQHIATFYTSLYIVLLLNLKQDFLWTFHAVRFPQLPSG